VLPSRAARRVRRKGVLSLAKLAGTDQRYYLDQAAGRVDHAGSVSSGAEDYYLAGPEAAGRWTGSAARALGLNGRVSEQSLRAVLSQQDPRSGVKLAGPAARARVPGFDLMFSVPKSASVLFGIGDERLQHAVLAAQERAVAAGMAYLERHACCTRMGAGGHEIVESDGLVGAAFGHRTSRAGDPQIHTHVLVANATRRADGLWGTLDGRQLYVHAKTAGYVHEAVFRRELTDRRGVQWRAARNGIADIEGVSNAVVDAFSRRRAEIDARVTEWGRSSAAARQSAALATRARKDYGVTPAMLAPEWRERARALGLDQGAIDVLLDRPAREALPRDVVAERLVSPRGLTAQASTFDRRDVVQAFAAAALDGANLEEIEARAELFLGREDVVTLAAGAGGHVQRADVIRRADGRTVAAVADAPRYSTVELLATEQQVVEGVLARRGENAGVVDRAVLDRVIAARPTLGADQAMMVRRLCSDGDGAGRRRPTRDRQDVRARRLPRGLASRWLRRLRRSRRAAGSQGDVGRRGDPEHERGRVALRARARCGVGDDAADGAGR
jgi:conjugative relaxase-like TrwC/TraI family protein